MTFVTFVTIMTSLPTFQKIVGFVQRKTGGYGVIAIAS